MKSFKYIFTAFFFILISVELPAQLKVKNSTGNVTIGSTVDANESLEIYGDGQLYDVHPYVRFKLNTSPSSLSKGGLHWKDNVNTENMRLYYSWNNNKLYIGPNGFENESHFTLDNSNGNVGIGTTNPSQELHVNGDIAVSGQIVGVSDRRTKKDIMSMGSVLDKIMQIDPVSYHYDDSQFERLTFPAGQQVGFVAQEIQKVFPELVSEFTNYSSEDGDISLQGVDYIKMIPILTKAIQEQQLMIEQLRKELEMN